MSGRQLHPVCMFVCCCFANVVHLHSQASFAGPLFGDMNEVFCLLCFSTSFHMEHIRKHNQTVCLCCLLPKPVHPHTLSRPGMLLCSRTASDHPLCWPGGSCAVLLHGRQAVGGVGVGGGDASGVC